MSMGKGISLFRHIAGTATATMYFINVLMTSITALILSFVNIHNAIALMWTYFLLIFNLIVSSMYLASTEYILIKLASHFYDKMTCV
jgi:hypothetical protein